MESEVTHNEQGAFEIFLDQPSQDTFGALFHSINPRLAGYFRTCGCENGLADELAQDVMFAVYKHSRALRDRRLFGSWLFKIARNTLFQYLRKKRRQLPTADLEGRTICGTEADPSAWLWVGQCLNWLEPGEREILLLRYFEGFEYHEIASTLHVPLGTVQWKVFHSKQKLAARLGAEKPRRNEARRGRLSVCATALTLQNQ